MATPRKGEGRHGLPSPPAPPSANGPLPWSGIDPKLGRSFVYPVVVGSPLASGFGATRQRVLGRRQSYGANLAPCRTKANMGSIMQQGSGQDLGESSLAMFTPSVAHPVPSFLSHHRLGEAETMATPHKGEGRHGLTSPPIGPPQGSGRGLPPALTWERPKPWRPRAKAKDAMV